MEIILLQGTYERIIRDDKMLKLDKRFNYIFNEVEDNVIIDFPKAKKLLKLFYLKGLIQGIDMAKDSISASQMQEIVDEIQGK